MDIDCHSCPINCFLKKSLTPSEVNLLNDNHAFVSYKAKENIFRKGLPVNYLKILLTGKVKLHIEGKNGNILKFEKGQKMLSGPVLTLDNIHQYSATAITNVDVCFINIDTVNIFLQQNHQSVLDYFSKFSVICNELQSTLNLMANQNPKLKLIYSLVYLSEQIYESTNFEIEFSKKELLEFVGISNENYKKELKWLIKSDLIQHHNKKFILNDILKLKKMLV